MTKQILTRRTALSAFGVGVAAVTVGGSQRSAVARAPRPLQSGSLDSGALGLSRDEFVDAMGEGQFVEEGADYNLYEYGVDAGLMYVAFSDYGDVEMANYVEVQFGSDGYPHDLTEQLVQTLIPGDARISETYLAPASPSGPTAIKTSRYVSESLGSIAPGGATEFLSMRMQKWSEEDGWRVNSLHLVTAEIGQ